MEDSAGLELGFFLHFSLPLRTEEELLEETFALAYVSEGAFTFMDIWGSPMTRGQRDWMIKRLSQQKADERAKHEARLAEIRAQRNSK